MSIPQEAVEVAIDKACAIMRSDFTFEDIAQIVGAAAPLIQAAAWAEGYEDGVTDGDPAIQSKIERGVASATPNPYQETK